MADQESFMEFPIPPGAEGRMPEIVAEVERIYEQIYCLHRDKMGDLLVAGDHHGIFRYLEDLIQDHVLDQLLVEDQRFRRLMASVYGLRHPRLHLEDVGISILEQGDELDAERHRREREENRANPQKARELLAKSLAELEAEGITLTFDKSSLKEAPEATEKDRVPLAPALGGPAPRQPFTTGWTYRPPKVSQYPPSFDPKKTCDQFLPPQRLPAKDKKVPGFVLGDVDEEEDGEGQEHDEDTGNTVLDVMFSETVSVVRNRMLAKKRKAMMYKKKQGKKVVGGELLQTPEQHLKTMRDFCEERGRPSSHLTLKDAEESLERIRGVLKGRTLSLGQKDTTTLQTPVEQDLQQILGTGDEKDNDEEDSDSPVVGNDADVEDIEMTGGNAGITSDPQPPLQRTSTKARAELPKPGVYDPNWLLKFLEATEMATEEELGMVTWRGWKIHSPKIQLIRIKNFLADEDIDRTRGWDMHFAETASYLRYLIEEVYDGTQSWGWDLKEAKQMLQTHWAFQKYNYDSAKLNIHFKTPQFEQRLIAPKDAPDIALTEFEPEEVKPRYLIHRIPESIHDVDYQIPGRLLRTRFIRWFRDDIDHVWMSDPFRTGTAGSGERREIFLHDGYGEDFNTAEVEDEMYAKCMLRGTLETSRALREECNFTITAADLLTDINTAIWPSGGTSKEWSRFRGAKRAAIQQCLANFDGSENTELITPFRKLVLPIPFRERKRLEEEAQKKIVYSNFAIKAPPTNVKVDPFCWTHWHKQLLENHEEKARLTFKAAQASYHSCAMNSDKTDNRRVDLTSNNFNGPYVPSFLYRNCEQARKTFNELKQVHDVLKRACRRAPRPVLKKMLRFVEAGLDEDFEVPHGLNNEEFNSVHDELAVQWELKEDAGERPEEVFPVPDADTIWWLRFIASPSTNQQMVEHKANHISELDGVFLERLQQLLDDPWGGGILSKHKRWASVPKITEALNNKGQADRRSKLNYVFDETYVEDMCDTLAQMGFLSRKATGSKAAFARPYCDIHPEDRINWRVNDTLDSHGNRIMPAHPQNDKMPPARDASVLDWHMAGAVHLLDEVNLAESPDPSLRSRTERALMLIGLRLGYNLRVTRDLVYEAYEQLEDKGLGESPCIDVDIHLLQTRDMHNMFWRGTATRKADPSCVSYGAVVRAADPSLWTEAMSRDTYNLRAVELVRQNKIRELSEAENMLWPVREVWHTDPATGEARKTYRRETIWDFAREAAHRPRKKFFTLDRWPVHVQSDARAREITGCGFQGTHMDVEYSVAVGQALDEAEAAREAERARLRAEIARVEELKEMALREAAKPIPAHEYLDPKWQFIRQKEFWLGDTPRQRKSFEQMTKAHFETLLPAERLPGFGNVYPPPGALSSNRRYDPSAPEVRIPRLPKVLRSRIPRARPYAPEKEVEAESDSEPPLVDAFLPMDNQFTISMAEPEEPEETT